MQLNGRKKQKTHLTAQLKCLIIQEVKRNQTGEISAERSFYAQ